MEHAFVYRIDSDPARNKSPDAVRIRYPVARARSKSLKERFMHSRTLNAIVLASSLTFLMPATSMLALQSAKQDMKQAGTETKDAAQDAGHGVAKGSKKVYHKTKHGTKVATHKTVEGTKSASKTVSHDTKTAAHKTAHGTKDVLHKVEDK